MRSLALLALVVAACAPSPSPPASSPAPPPPSPLAVAPAVLDAWLARDLAPRVPSAVVAIVDRTGVRWRGAVGARDARGGAAPDPATAIYRIGSVTKVLTATAVLQLRDAGRLELDDPVARFTPELAGRLAGVTVRHLLTHTSGIPSTGDRSAPYWTTTPPDAAAMLRALDVPLELVPGSKAAYSNAGMALAGLVVARASGQPYRAYLGAHVLGPLGMRTAAWDREAVAADRLAIGVGPDGTIDPPHWQLGAFEPAGGLYASLDDLAAVARLVFGDAPEVLAPASVRAAISDDPLPGPHGAAWIVGELEGRRFATHTGSTSDYAATIWIYPDAGVAGLVLAAGDDAELAECAAVGLATAAVTGEPPRSCAPPALDQPAYDRALTRLRAVLAGPTDATVAELFTPGFLAQIPRAQLDAVAAVVAARFGRCERHTVPSPRPFGAASQLQCERGTLDVELHVDPDGRIGLVRFPGL